MKNRIINLLAILIFIIGGNYNDIVNAQRIVNVSDYGLNPDTRENAVPFLKRAIDICRSGDVILNFPQGRYDFWPDECEKKINVPFGIAIDSIDNLIIDGNDSEFIFHGKMSSISIWHCKNTTVRNINIDWDRPRISQATVQNVTDNFIDIEVDYNEYPYIIADGALYFVGEGWRSIVGHHCLFDKEKKEIVYRTSESPLGEIDNFKAEEISRGKIRLFGSIKYKPEPGTFIAFYPVRENYRGISLYKNKNTRLENINIYHSAGSGIHSFFCDGLIFRNTNITVNNEKGRVFSALADATYFPNCKGLILIDSCHHRGQTDDWANFRGTYTIITELPSSEKVNVWYKGRSAEEYYHPGDEVWIVNTGNMQREDTRKIKSVRLLDTGDTEIVFTSPLPHGTKQGYALENKTWVPEVEVRNCTIPKCHRARGILLSTPKRALFENNYFNTAGTAILVEGDVTHWFEAGAVRDFTIRDNIFDNCLTSGTAEANSGRSGWGTAIITITPSFMPTSNEMMAYHNNIIIEKNIFKTFDIPIIKARSVNNLQFKNNEIIRTYDYEPYAKQKYSFSFDGCRNVVIKNNKFSDDYKTRSAIISHMRESDIVVDPGNEIKLFGL